MRRIIVGLVTLAVIAICAVLYIDQDTSKQDPPKVDVAPASSPESAGARDPQDLRDQKDQDPVML